MSRPGRTHSLIKRSTCLILSDVMKVILLKDVGGVGQRGTVKDISDGYALNYLIPRGLAKQATPDALQDFEKNKAAHDKAAAENHAKLIEKIKLIDGKTYEMKVRANEKGHLFKRIGASDVAKAIGPFVAPEMISGIETFKSVGEYDVKITAAGTAVAVKLKILEG